LDHLIDFESSFVIPGLGGDKDSFIAAFDRFGGIQLWNQTAGSPDDDCFGGIEISNFQDVRIAFSSNGANPSVGSFQVPSSSTTTPLTGFHFRLDEQATVLGGTEIASSPNSGDTFLVGDLAVTPNGTSFISCNISGDFAVGPDFVNATDKFGLAQVNASDQIFDFRASEGTSVDTSSSVALPTPEEAFLGGTFTGATGTIILDDVNIASNANSRGILAFTEFESNQERYIVWKNGAPAPGDLQLVEDAIRNAQGEPAHYINYPQFGVYRIAAYLPDDAQTSLPGSGFNIEFDMEFTTQSATSGTDIWGLSKLNSGLATSPYTPFSAPTTYRQVHLYLIDTSIRNTDNYFTTSTDLSIGDLIYFPDVSAIGTSHYTTHGSHMLSLIAGPTSGVAVNTPIDVEIYDVFDDASSEVTNASNIGDAIWYAAADLLANHPFEPGTISISLGSSLNYNVSDSNTLATAINEALAQGLPVVVSAGNNTSDASSYLPSDFGATSGVLLGDMSGDNGVICVGGLNENLTVYSKSNTGADVDVSAPGCDVQAFDETGGSRLDTTTTDGTSVSAAMTTGAVLILKSANPFLSPGDIEALLKSKVYGARSLVQVAPSASDFAMDYSDFATWFSLSGTPTDDDDGDNILNRWEYYRGSSPLKKDLIGSLISIGPGSDIDHRELAIDLADYLYNPASKTTLRDASTYAFVSSIDLGSVSAWSTIAETPSLGTPIDNQFRISADTELVNDKDFYRFEITP
ncbi:MAG: S8 family serine peptidase, partial [Verrucomicrobiota bacterium]